MIVQEAMVKDFPVCTAEYSILQTLQLFATTDSHIIPVVNDADKLTALITKNRVLHALAKGASTSDAIASFLVHQPVFLYPGTPISDARTQLLHHSISHAPVVNESHELVGLLTTAQILASYDLVFDRMESQLSLLFENMHFGLISVDTNMNITTANPMAEMMFNISSSGRTTLYEVDGLQDFAYLLADSLSQTHSSIKRKVISEERSLYVHSYPLKEKEKLIGAIVMTDDWTNFEKVANELRFSKEWEEKLRSLIELAYDGFILVNEKGEITMVNKGFSDLFSMKDTDILHEPVSDLFPELGFSEVLSKGVKVLNAAKLINNTQCLLTAMPIKNNEEIIGGICKITYRGLKQLQEALSKVSTLEQQLRFYKQELNELKGTKYSFADIVGDSKAIRQAKQDAAAASKTSSTVLLLGESGTGKELFAHGIHAASASKGKLVQVNCSAIPHDLMESEFFGYAEGAFTGAKKGGKKGKLEAAQNGTLFLDEIGDMPLELQAKLLRVLQEKEFEPVGSSRVIRLQTKVIAATNKSLEELISQGVFREDLYYRLNIMRIEIPSLRDRIEDLPVITDSIIYKLRMSGFDITGITHSALSKLLHYNWPGNVRELHNIIERAANLTEDGYIGCAQLPDIFGAESAVPSASPPAAAPFQINTKRTEKEAVIAALEEANGNKAKASRELGISRTWLYKKMKEYGID